MLLAAWPGSHKLTGHAAQSKAGAQDDGPAPDVGHRSVGAVIQL